MTDRGRRTPRFAHLRDTAARHALTGGTLTRPNVVHVLSPGGELEASHLHAAASTTTHVNIPDPATANAAYFGGQYWSVAEIVREDDRTACRRCGCGAASAVTRTRSSRPTTATRLLRLRKFSEWGLPSRNVDCPSDFEKTRSVRHSKWRCASGDRLWGYGLDTSETLVRRSRDFRRAW